MGNSERVLVTGGHGFVGSHLVDLLLRQDVSVRCLLRPGRSMDVFEGKPVEVVRGDLRGREGLADAVRGVTRVYHIAGLIAARGPGHFDSVNRDGTRRLAEAVAVAAPECRRFVYVSSQAAAGPSRDGVPLDESAPPHPVTHYGRSKLGGEQVLAPSLGTVPWTIVRPPAVYGPRDRGVLPFFQLAARGLAADLDGPGRRFNMIHANDLAEGIRVAGAARASVGRIYFLADAKPCSYRDVGAALAAAFGRKLWRLPVPDVVVDLAAVAADELAALTGKPQIFGRQKAIELKSRYWLCSPARAQADFGWSVRLGLEEGMAETARWYREAGWL